MNPPLWKKAMRAAVRDPDALRSHLGLGQADAAEAQAHGQFPVRVPPSYLAQIGTKDDDPLLRQVMPTAQELRPGPADVVGDLAASALPGVIHKYHGRVLLVAGGACAIHCRYCFRRHFPYGEQTAASGDWSAAVAYIAQQPEINEVILSGGDPLMLSNDRLASLTSQLRSVPHVRRLRIHSRVPVVLPERVDDGLLAWLNDVPLQKVLVTHVNHSREIGESAAHGLRELRRNGTRLLNQSVLLRGVNDEDTALIELSEALFDHGVMPYYLHLLDEVGGTEHFSVDATRARTVMEGLRRRQAGYLVPRLVREQAGYPYKIPIM